MRRWWYHVGKVRTVDLATILSLVGGIDDLRSGPIFVAVGSDLRKADAALLARSVTPWGMPLHRRAAPGDGTGSVTLHLAHEQKSSVPTRTSKRPSSTSVCAGAPHGLRAGRPHRSRPRSPTTAGSMRRRRARRHRWHGAKLAVAMGPAAWERSQATKATTMRIAPPPPHETQACCGRHPPIIFGCTRVSDPRSSGSD